MNLCKRFLKNGFNGKSEAEILEEITLYLTNYCDIYNTEQESAKKILKSFIQKWTKRWRDSSYSWQKFSLKNADWLEKNVFSDVAIDENSQCTGESEPGPSKRKCFSDLSKSQKDRTTKGDFFISILCTVFTIYYILHYRRQR